MSRPRQVDAGVTLIEVLVSLAIFAVIGLAGLAVLNTVARTGERTDGRLERLSEIDRAFLVLRRDLMFAAPASLTLEQGRLGLARAEGADLRPITYQQEEARLLRVIGGSGAPVDQPLLSEVGEVSWRILAGGWQEDWPAAAPGGADPKAVELRLELPLAQQGTMQVITRLFPLLPRPLQ
jgi:general secretion pathway protein J